jgi:cytochrome c-type biogenesis protein CcmE
LGQVRAHDVRLGGLVVKGSVKKIPETLKIYFTLTDGHQNIEVRYDGILPALFREGQGIVAQGQLNNFGIFVADQVLAKHDSNYKPPEIK